ncbi:hypothetical protein, partial [Phytoactinopolyspora endophytica]|uniref:hypothetical protein n=1 Tax=Phytoactinopolyspora endophytica TaxID=1642495 RepID=UPI00197C118C
MRVSVEDWDKAAERSLTIGLVADPGLPAEFAQGLSEWLPEQLSETFDDQVSWEVEVRLYELPLDDDGQVALVRGVDKRLREEGWDLMVCLTELPRRLGVRPHVFDLSMSNAAALVSVPALGWFRARARVRATVAYLISRLAAPILGWSETDRRSAHGRRPATKIIAGAHEIPGEEENIEAHVALSGRRGKVRLLFGMVRTNRPWRLVPSMSTAIAAAMGIAAFGVFYSNMWELGDALSPLRKALVMVLAIAAMSTWLIIYNTLWERPSAASARQQSVLYNVSTVVTLLIGVAFMYAVLFGAIVVAALVVISSDYLESTLGHPVSFADYVNVAWLASSMGTVAGAVGSSLEGEEAVRQATYSKREREHRTLREEEE